LAASDLVVIPATEGHAIRMAPWMRAEDEAEIMASHGHKPLEGLQASLKQSAVARTVMYQGEIAAIFGVAMADGLAGHGSVWLLSSELVEEVPLLFLRRSKKELRKLQAPWPILTNFVDARYKRAVRWVEWLGFEVGEPVPFGVAGLPFHPIRLRRA
jgi:hypothetical protein